MAQTTFAKAAAVKRVVKNGRLKQSVTRWTYRSIPLPDLCRAAAGMGLTAIDLLEEPDWAVVRQFGLVCSMGYAGGGSIADGLNVKANHDAIVVELRAPHPARRGRTRTRTSSPSSATGAG